MDAIAKHWGLYLFEGILFVLLGILAIALPGFFTLGLELLIGWLFIISGIIEGYRYFKTHDIPGHTASILSAILYLIIGVLLLVYPLAGILSLTMLLTVFFILEGIAKVYLAFKLKPLRHWGVLLFNGIIALIMAAIIIGGWPLSAVWVIGLLVGINMLFFGFSLIWISLASRSAST